MPRPRKRVKLEGEELSIPAKFSPEVKMFVSAVIRSTLTNKSLGIHLIDE